MVFVPEPSEPTFWVMDGAVHRLGVSSLFGGGIKLEGEVSARGDKLARVINENLIKLILQSTISHSMFGTNTSFHVK